MLRRIPSCYNMAVGLLQADARLLLLPQVEVHLNTRKRTVLAAWASETCTKYFSTENGVGPSSSQREAVEKMVDMMVTTPALQQMMMAALPPQMRNPQALQAMFNNPATRAQIVDMIARQGAALPPEVLQRIGNTGDLEASLNRAEQMGLSPHEMFQRLLQYPGLMQKFQDPRVVRAFLDISQNPDNLEKYRDQPDIIEVYFKAKEVLLPKQQKPFEDAPEAVTSTSTGTSTSSINLPPPEGASPFPVVPDHSSDSLAKMGDALGIGSDEVLQRLLSNPKAVAALSNPKVQHALQDVAGSKWKMVKYMFDPEIRDAVKELQGVLDAPKKQ